MSDRPVIYEVNLRPEPAIAAEFDVWLRKHVRDMLALPGFLEAAISTRVDGDEPEPTRTVQYRLLDRAALDRYLEEHAPRMRAEGIDAFGDRFTADRRILESAEQLRAQPKTDGICSNCEAELHGQYCASCGQRSRRRMITVWELVREASDLLTSLDSRLWRTLGLLMFRPGSLTRNYLEGRRARYVAPLRLFIAASVIFFFTAAVTADLDVSDRGLSVTIDPDTSVSVSDDGDGVTAAPDSDDGDGITAAPDSGDGSGITNAPGDRAEGAAEDSQAAPETSPESPVIGNGTTPEQQETGQAGDAPDAGPAAAEGDGFDCDSADLEINLSGPAWLENYFTEARIRATCHKIVDDRGASLAGALMENIPVMMFIFLPFMAGVMKLVYPLSGRYYVEHLLFLVHYHSFFYLLTTAALVTGWLGGRWIMPEWPGALMTAVAFIYPPIYLYKAMRKVYGQSRWVTTVKYALLFIAYFVFLVLTFLGTLMITALTL